MPMESLWRFSSVMLRERSESQHPGRLREVQSLQERLIMGRDA